MNNSPVSKAPGSSSSLQRTALFAAAILLVSLLLGLLFVAVIHKLNPAPKLPPVAAALSGSLDGNTVTNLDRLIELRRNMRVDGCDTEELNLRIWAAHALQPTALFHIAPPSPDKRWNWHLSQDGLFAIAVSIQTDAVERRAAGLFDLVANEWVWKANLLWPDSYESPYVFNRHLVVRYSKNGKHFAMEVDSHGVVTGIDSLGKSAFSVVPPLSPVPGFPGEPVAIKNGVLFTSDAGHQSLNGYALEKIPGLRYAGKGDQNTLFSGNGLLKFSANGGCITVADSLTQTVLQRVSAWPNNTGTLVTGSLVTHDGSQLSVFLKTQLPGTPAVAREWSVGLATYAGTVTPSFSADALLAKPRHVNQSRALSPDGRWQMSISPSNVLSVVALPQNREMAKVNVGSILGLRSPIDHIAFLEEGHHLVIRQNDNFWLLDFTAVRGHADLLERKNASAQASAAVLAAGPAAALASGATTTNQLDAAMAAAAGLALRAEWYASHQAWGYTAALLAKASTCSSGDGRVPHINPLLQAHAYFLSGQSQKARVACRDALKKLVADPSDCNRMIRYQLQGLLFSQP